MASEPHNCAICNRPQADGVSYLGHSDGLLVTCPQCGRYVLADRAAIGASFQWTPKIRQALSCATRQAFETGQLIPLTASNVAELAEPRMHTRVADNQERLLREIARRSGRPDGEASFLLATDFTLIDCYSKEEFYWYISWLVREELAFKTDFAPTGVRLNLSMNGWKRVQPVSRPGGIPGR
jgi:hypothetical protein